MISSATDRRRNENSIEHYLAAEYFLEDQNEMYPSSFDEFNHSTDPINKVRSAYVSLGMIGTITAGITGLGTSGMASEIAEDLDESIYQRTIDNPSRSNQFAKWIISTLPVEKPPQNWHTINLQIAQSLGRLEDGWLGEGSLCPSDILIDTILKAGSILPIETSEPACEVDEDTGDVTFRWVSPNIKSSFSLIFKNAGPIVGILITKEQTHPAWQLQNDESSKVANIVDDSVIREILTA